MWDLVKLKEGEGERGEWNAWNQEKVAKNWMNLCLLGFAFWEDSWEKRVSLLPLKRSKLLSYFCPRRIFSFISLLQHNVPSSSHLYRPLWRYFLLIDQYQLLVCDIALENCIPESKVNSRHRNHIEPNFRNSLN